MEKLPTGNRSPSCHPAPRRHLLRLPARSSDAARTAHALQQPGQPPAQLRLRLPERAPEPELPACPPRNSRQPVRRCRHGRVSRDRLSAAKPPRRESARQACQRFALHCPSSTAAAPAPPQSLSASLSSPTPAPVPSVPASLSRRQLPAGWRPPAAQPVCPACANTHIRHTAPQPPRSPRPSLPLTAPL